MADSLLNSLQTVIEYNRLETTASIIEVTIIDGVLKPLRFTLKRDSWGNWRADITRLPEKDKL